eukprot:scaffold28641_cov31-Tisochrysis_lutea.AAC.3
MERWELWEWASSPRKGTGGSSDSIRESRDEAIEQRGRLRGMPPLAPERSILKCLVDEPLRHELIIKCKGDSSHSARPFWPTLAHTARKAHLLLRRLASRIDDLDNAGQLCCECFRASCGHDSEHDEDGPPATGIRRRSMRADELENKGHYVLRGNHLRDGLKDLQSRAAASALIDGANENNDEQFTHAIDSEPHVR